MASSEPRIWSFVVKDLWWVMFHICSTETTLPLRYCGWSSWTIGMQSTSRDGRPVMVSVEL